MPSISAGPRSYVDRGVLIYYGQDEFESFRRAADYVDRILKGANPAELPIAKPSKFDFIINLRTAKALGLTIPQAVLSQASEVIRGSGRSVWAIALGVALLGACSGPLSPAPLRVYRVGWLSGNTQAQSTLTDALREALREVGYIEGRNLILEARYAEGRAERYTAIAAEFVALKVDVIVVSALPGALALKHARRASRSSSPTHLLIRSRTAWSRAWRGPRATSPGRSRRSARSSSGGGRSC